MEAVLVGNSALVESMIDQTSELPRCYQYCELTLNMITNYKLYFSAFRCEAQLMLRQQIFTFQTNFINNTGVSALPATYHLNIKKSSSL